MYLRFIVRFVERRGETTGWIASFKIFNYEVISSMKERKWFLGESSRCEIVNLESGKTKIKRKCGNIAMLY